MPPTVKSHRPSTLAIQSILASVFGTLPNHDTIHFIPYGTVTYAYTAEVPSIGPVVVKVRRTEKDSFSSFFAHFWATNQWRSLGVPAPEVFFFDSDHCVEQRMPGYHHTDTPLSSQEQDTFLTHMAELFQRLHSITCSHYGYIKDRKKAITWTALLENTFGHAFLTLRDSPVLSSQEFAKLEKLLMTALPSLTPSKPSLLHGDLHGFNYLVQGDTVTGVLDAAESLGGDPHYDLASFANTHPEFQSRMTTFYDHYKGCDVERVRVYRAAIGARKLVNQGIRQQDHQRIAREKATLLTLL